MIQRGATAAGIKTKIGNHTFRATSITAYPLINHERSRTTKLYDRRVNEISLDEMEPVAIFRPRQTFAFGFAAASAADAFLW